MTTTRTHPLRSLACVLLILTGLPSARSADFGPREINKAIRAASEQWFAAHPTARVYIQLNKPLFQAGEALRFKVSVMATDTLKPLDEAPGCNCELLNPQGVPIASEAFKMTRGSAAGHFLIPGHARGGEYVLKASVIGGPAVERKLTVHSYEPPQIKKRLDILGKAYGPGDRVDAQASFHRATGEPLAQSEIQVTCTVDGKPAFTDTLTTNDTGDLQLSFELPSGIATDRAYLMLRAKDGDRIESISRTIPILTTGLAVAFYPEGGDLVAGLPCRIYFAATKPNGKPAKLEGTVHDETGCRVVKVASFHHGMGCFELTPELDRHYQLDVTRPTGAGGPFKLPAAKPSGLVMRVEPQGSASGRDCRITFQTSHDLRDVTVIAALRDNLLATETVDIARPAKTVLLPLPPMQGCLRLSVLDRRGFPLCERLVYRDSGRDMVVTLTPDKEHYTPREKVTIDIQTTLPDGRPCAAELAVSVVDDRVLAFADDKTANLLTRVYLEADLPGEIVEPNFYLDPNQPDSRRALDLLLGTRGWRKFRWDVALNPAAGRDVRVTDQIFVDTMAKVRAASAERETHPRRRTYDGGGSDDFRGGDFGGMGGGDDFGGADVGGGAVAALEGPAADMGGTGIAKKLGPALALEPGTPVATLAQHPTWMRLRPLGQQPRPMRHRPPRGGGEDDFGEGDFGGDDFGDEGGWGPDEQMYMGPCVTMSMDNIPLGEVIRYICIAAGLAFQVEPQAVLIGPDFTIPPRKASTAAISQKLRDIIIPNIEFEECPVDEVMKVLKRRSIELDPDGEGINIMLVGMEGFMAQYEEDALSPGAFRYHWSVVRQFPRIVYETIAADVRDDFRECIHWEPTFSTNVLGHGRLEFHLNDATTSFRLTAEGNAGVGLPGRGERVVDSRTSVHVDCEIPALLSASDVVVLPIHVTNEGRLPERVHLEVALPDCLTTERPLLLSQDILIHGGKAETVTVPLTAVVGEGHLTVSVTSIGLREQVSHHVDVRSSGFPGALSHSGLLRGSHRLTGTIPKTLVPDSLTALIRFYPTPLAGLEEALESMLRMPTGCFEQTSSSTHPNILITSYLRKVGAMDPRLEKRTQSLLAEGYRKLLTFQCPDGGFGWYGKDVPSTPLTAYGIMQLTEMAHVFDGVDAAVLERAKRWLLAQRDGKGGFASAKDSRGRFGREGVTDVYTTWALSEAGVTDVADEVTVAARKAEASDDPYLTALTLLAATNLGKLGTTGRNLATKLVEQQQQDGSFASKHCSFTGSRGKTMAVESTALAIMALREVGMDDAARRAVLWLAEQRKGGRFGSTQATVLALRALMEVEPSGSGELAVGINGKSVAVRHVGEHQMGTVRLEGFADLLKVGDNDIALQFSGSNDIGYSIDLRMMTTRPANEPDSPILLTLSPTEITLGQADVVDVVAEVRNVSENALGMTIVYIGVPAGMRPVLRQLEELKDDGKVALFETGPSEIVLYLDDVLPGARLQVPIRLHADHVGTYSGLASCAYAYYNDESRWWADPLKVTIGK